MNLVEKIMLAYQRIAPYIYETPLEHSTLLSKKYASDIFLKCENFQRTGSFKFRGALNKVLTLQEDSKVDKVVAASTGNHGKAVTLAAQTVGIKPIIYVPENASQIKIQSIETMGAEIKLCQGDCLAAETTARQFANSNNIPFISPYNDIDVISGQGTIGLELAKQCKDLDAVFVAVGGGGLISGIGAYLKSINPNIQAIACWPQNAQSMYQCLKAGCVIDFPEEDTISDATAGGPEVGTITLQLCKNVIDDAIFVAEDEITNAMKEVASYESMMIEGAAGVALAGYIKVAEQYKNKKVAVILCGRNIVLDKFLCAVNK